MTHLHFDHASGLTKWEENHLASAFPNAKIYVSETEWNEMRTQILDHVIHIGRKIGNRL